jgi:ribosomal protein L36
VKGQKWCNKCYGHGVRREGFVYVICGCGRFVDSWGTKKLAERERLEKRLEQIRETKKW